MPGWQDFTGCKGFVYGNEQYAGSCTLNVDARCLPTTAARSPCPEVCPLLLQQRSLLVQRWSGPRRFALGEFATIETALHSAIEFAHCVCRQYDSMAFDCSTRLIRQLDSRSRPCVLGIQCKLLLHRLPQNSELFRGPQSSRSASRFRHNLVHASAKGAFEVVHCQFVLKMQLMLTCC